MDNLNHLLAKLLVALAFLVLIAVNWPMFIVQPGSVAMHLRAGSFKRAVNNPGWYFKAPLIDDIIYLNNRICKQTIETEALSKDLQSINIGVAINYRIKDPINLFNQVGTDFERVIIDPYAQESIKAVVAQYSAEDIIQHRHEAKDKVCVDLRSRLEEVFIEVVEFNFAHLDFHDAFINAVEQKQIAEQSAKTAKNLTVKIKEEALQSRERADAEMYALKVKKEALTPDLIRLKAIEKWDGRLPQVSGANTPFIRLGE